MTVNDNYRYTKDHEWVSVTSGTAKMGISDFAQGELGEVVFVDLPKVGKKVEKGSVLCVVESTKAASDVYAPISGEVIEVNAALTDTPSLINNAPYEDGWIAKIKIANEGEINELYDANAYRKLVEGK